MGSVMPSDPLQGGELAGKGVQASSKTYEIMMSIRKRKHLKEEKPCLMDYYDKL